MFVYNICTVSMVPFGECLHYSDIWSKPQTCTSLSLTQVINKHHMQTAVCRLPIGMYVCTLVPSFTGSSSRQSPHVRMHPFIDTYNDFSKIIGIMSLHHLHCKGKEHKATCTPFLLLSIENATQDPLILK